ncbi:hypothetical protein HDU67_002910 [Dinochytrium kinnereticum]|nr:hypothetical protein HDU67_002910 [Dinochytrium kinnereticum]
MMSEPGSGPSLTLHYNPTLNLIQIQDPPSPTTSNWTTADHHTHCLQTYETAATHNNGHFHRFIYALTGRVFVVTAPRPIGGKREPGFRAFNGSSAEDVLDWILGIAAAAPLTGRGRKRQPPGEILRFVVGEMNLVLELSRRGEGRLGAKDEMDNLVLRGMAQAGHLPQTGRTLLPERLRVSMGGGLDDELLMWHFWIIVSGIRGGVLPAAQWL